MVSVRPKKGTAKEWRRVHRADGTRKRKYKKASYKIFFDRMEEGTLRVDIETGVIEIFCRREKRWRTPHIYLDHKDLSRGYAFVTIYHKGARRRVSVSRLIYMVANAVESIPKGYEVDHDDEDITNIHYTNLVLVPKGYNAAKRHGNEDEYEF